jgi:hypothetical protein
MHPRANALKLRKLERPPGQKYYNRNYRVNTPFKPRRDKISPLRGFENQKSFFATIITSLQD